MSPHIPSYEKIDYNLRPAKNVERKMIVESVRRLDRALGIRSYTYVGLGSPYYSDFTLLHRRLHIGDMVCLEREEDDEERMKFNKPFNCIELKMVPAAAYLPVHEWSTKPTMAWLDHDSLLDTEILSELRTVSKCCKRRTILVVTVNADPRALGHVGQRLSALERLLGRAGVPADVTDGRVSGENNLAALFYDLITQEIRDAVSSKVLEPGEKGLHFEQFLHFRYRDSSLMLTVGGIFLDEDDRDLLENCGISQRDLDYFRPSKEWFEIPVPKLTFRELRHLDSILPRGTMAGALRGIPEDQADAYRLVYRYFPGFVDAEF